MCNYLQIFKWINATSQICFMELIGSSIRTNRQWKVTYFHPVPPWWHSKWHWVYDFKVILEVSDLPWSPLIPMTHFVLPQDLIEPPSILEFLYFLERATSTTGTHRTSSYPVGPPNCPGFLLASPNLWAYPFHHRLPRTSQVSNNIPLITFSDSLPLNLITYPGFPDIHIIPDTHPVPLWTSHDLSPSWTSPYRIWISLIYCTTKTSFDLHWWLVNKCAERWVTIRHPPPTRR